MENRSNESCKVSVIVPVYRVEKYIDRCMRSLLKQTLKDIEIVCICEEEDSSFGKLLTYEKKDNRVHIIKKKNTGVSAARNAGMRAACGKYLAFVDADDWIESYALKTLYMVAERYSAQIIAYGIWPTKEPRGDKRGMFKYSPDRNVLYRNSGMKALFYEHGSKPYIGNKFYNRQFLMDNNIWFHEDIDIGEDQLLQFEAFGQAETICFVKDKLYHYDIKRNDSAMNTCEVQKTIENRNFKLLQIIMDQKSKRYGDEYDKEYTLWILQYYGGIVNQGIQSITEERKEKIFTIQKYLREMAAEEHLNEVPKEYREICARVMNYRGTETGYETIQLPYHEYEVYMSEQVSGEWERIRVTEGIEGIFDKIKRLYEAIVFHEIRHMATKVLVRFGMF